jgi:hypothetical protein
MIGIDLLPLTQPRFIRIKSCDWTNNRMFARAAYGRSHTATCRLKSWRRLPKCRLIVTTLHRLCTGPVLWPDGPCRAMVVSFGPDQSRHTKPQYGQQRSEGCKDKEWPQEEQGRSTIKLRICQESALLCVRRRALKRRGCNRRSNPQRLAILDKHGPIGQCGLGAEADDSTSEERA